MRWRGSLPEDQPSELRPNLDSALHLEPQKSPGGIDDEKIQFAFKSGIALPRQDEPTGVEDRPVAGQVPFEGREDLALGVRSVSVGAGRKHPGHGDVYTAGNRHRPTSAHSNKA
jgi:hypothetical protein